MSAEKKAHPTAATVERVEGGTETGQVTTSISHDTTAAGSRQMGIGGE